MAFEYKVESSLEGFETWGGATAIKDRIIELGRVDEADNYLEATLFREEEENLPTNTEVNDAIWYDLAEQLKTWEEETPEVTINRLEETLAEGFDISSYALGTDFLELKAKHEEGESYLELSVWAYKEQDNNTEEPDHLEYLIGIRNENGEIDHIDEGDHEVNEWDTAESILENYIVMFQEEFRSL